jgi:hypothetical protein
MKPVDPAEISALMDGELPAERAEEVRRAIAEDPALRREYEEIVALDANVKAYAEAALFRPRVVIAVETAGPIPVVPLVIGCLLLRLVLKSAPFLVGTGLEICALVFVVTWALQRLLAASEQEGRRLECATDTS